MNTEHPGATSPGDAMPDALRWQLRALRRDEPPPRDLWADISPRLPPREPARPASPVRTPWLALAASLLLAVGLVGLWRGPAVGQGEGVALAEAERLSRQYERAIDRMPDAVSRNRELAPAIHELDRSAAQIRRALAHDPDSRLLLEQLRRTYAHRIALSQRAVLG